MRSPSPSHATCRHDSHVIAIDGGQTATVCVVGAGDGTICGAGHGGPIWHIAEPAGAHRLRAALGAAVAQALDHIGPQHAPIDAAYLSLTGSRSAALKMLPEFVTVDRVLAEGDERAALASGTRGGPGVGIVAGTGSVAIALGRRGESVIRGGWGPVLGDEGSGYWIGLQALVCIARSDDGRTGLTRLTARICEHLGVSHARDLFDLVYSGGLDRGRVAALTPLIVEVASDNDVEAARILERAVGELVNLAVATTKAAPFLAPSERVIVLTGGVLQADGPIVGGLVTKLRHELPDFRIIRPTVPPVIGAFYLALAMTGRHPDDAIVAAAESSLARFPDVFGKTPHTPPSRGFRPRPTSRTPTDDNYG
jgi:glucosamine kinase